MVPHCQVLPMRIFQMEVQLRAVESAVSFVDHIKAAPISSMALRQGVCPPFPILHRFPWNPPVSWKALHDIEIRTSYKRRRSELHHTFDLVVDLLRQHEDMGVILRKGSYPHQTVQSSRKFVPVYLTQFAAAE